MRPARYHKALVGLHWLLAVLMVLALGMGSTALANTPNDAPAKLDLLRHHMMAGNLILILSVIRLIVRLKTRHPTHAYAGQGAMSLLTTAAHYGLYLLTGLMCVSGIVLAAQTNLPSIVFDGVGALPASFSELNAHTVHGLAGTLLIMLIAGHLLAALYHQFIRRDRLMTRVWFGRS
ncbi:cytochrome b [Uliginosibacterium aquaticum]|uniref:Cytochrome b/b6 domain-containing protein n=1 Tax=Uliginosibacterium aquaticum TaxID=2731212 RepID=A0ABX2IFG1_9RHOO|nr:cytochrome b/b6 domain-containing protein [Uliginosibacterium aquaticum]NSL54553.1 cytochrome b/b6 domain-containing protein [Uliginosibacterium aquaticum]